MLESPYFTTIIDDELAVQLLGLGELPGADGPVGPAAPSGLPGIVSHAASNAHPASKAIVLVIAFSPSVCVRERHEARMIV
jgi:hypothetical protein